MEIYVVLFMMVSVISLALALYLWLKLLGTDYAPELDFSEPDEDE